MDGGVVVVVVVVRHGLGNRFESTARSTLDDVIIHVVVTSWYCMHITLGR